MTARQRQLVERFRALADDRQSVLELLSAAYSPRSRTDALGLVKAASIPLSTPGSTLSFPDWKPVVEELLGLELLVNDKHYILCNPLVREAMLSSAVRKDRLKRWIKAWKWKRSSRHRWVYKPGRRPYRPADLLPELRFAFHQNEAAKFVDLVEMWHQSPPWDRPKIDLAQTLLDCPFEEEWAYSRAPEIRDNLLSHFVDRSLSALKPVAEPIAVIRRILDEEKGYASFASLAAEYHLLAGDLAAAEALLARSGSWLEGSHAGWIACVQGRRDEALQHFNSAIKVYRKRTRRRLVVMPPLDAAMYAISLLWSGGHDRFDKAHAHLDLALRKRPAEEASLYWALKSVADHLAGKTDLASDLTRRVSIDHRLDPAARVLAHAALCVTNPQAAKEARDHLPQLIRQAAGNGYLWVALEAWRVLSAVADDSGGAGEGPWLALAESCRPLFAGHDEQPAWRRTLEALGSLDAAERPRGGQASRLVWRIDEAGSLKPYHQVLNKKGTWTAGRAVALRRLASGTYDGNLTDQDRRLCGTIGSDTQAYYGTTDWIINHDRAWPELVGHPQVYRADAPRTKVEIVSAEPRLRIAEKDGQLHLEVVPKAPKHSRITVSFETRSRMSVSVFEKKHFKILDVIGRDGLTVPPQAKPAVLRAIPAVSRLVAVHSDIGGGHAEAAGVEANPATRFQLTPSGDGLRVEPRVVPFSEGGPSFPPGKGGSAVFATIGGSSVRTVRNLEEETRRLGAAVAACPTLGEASWSGNGWLLGSPDSCLELLDELHRIRDEVSVAWPRGESLRIRHRADGKDLSLKIRSSRDWFRIGGSVKTDSGLVLDLRRVLAAMQDSDSRFVPLGDGQFVALTHRFRANIQQLGAFSSPKGKDLRFHQSRAHLLEGLADDAGSVDAGPKWKRWTRRFQDAQSLDPDLPSTLQAQLRDYQTLGFQWALRLASWGAGACLADDMGLGKTVQALAVALARARQGPGLVVAPTSVCSNWIDEARRFAPTLNALAFGRGDRKTMLDGLGPFDMVICSYALLRLEQKLLTGVSWSTVVLDEAQAIKNRQTQVSKAAMRLSAGFRMITTGTPVENHLGELWNLLHFLNPGLLGTAAWFHKQFAVPIHSHGDLAKKRLLKRLMQPFILRRTKSAVLDELPSRTEITIRVAMSDKEAAFYEAVRRQALESLAEEDGSGPGNVRILAEITRLRQACCHPQLVLPEADLPSSKLARFLETVAELKDGGHKALVFSQFVTHLAIVRQNLDRLGLSYRYLDGSTPAASRRQEVNRFQGGDGDLFLISLRAGGQGLNLTAADYVIHLDPWWNPAVEDQASDRAHRIGQTRPVTIYRLVMRGTIEEAILDLHHSKRDLADSLLEGTDRTGKLSAEELLSLIRGS